MEIQRHSIYRPVGRNHRQEDFFLDLQSTGFDPYLFSRFKHGCVESTVHMASRIAEAIKPFLSDHIDPVITSSAYFNAPTAATLLLDAMLADHFRMKSYDRIHLKRDHIFPFDYSSLDSGQREHSMNEITLNLDVSQIKNRPLLIVDDAYVSGAHERTIIRHLDQAPSGVVFFYLIDLSGYGSGELERVVNRASIGVLADLIPLLSHPDFTINSRVLKLILSAPFDEFNSFFSFLDFTQQRYLYTAAIAEGYDDFGPVFKEKLTYIQELFSRKSVA